MEKKYLILDLIVVLQGLVLGLRGKRRSALNLVISDLEDMIRRMIDILDDQGDELIGVKRELDDAIRKSLDLEAEVTRLKRRTWNWVVEVTSQFLIDNKSMCIKLLRTASPSLGLKEAKDAIEFRQNSCLPNYEWVVLAKEVSEENVDWIKSDRSFDRDDIRVREASE